MKLFRKPPYPPIPTITPRVIPWAPRSHILGAVLAVLCFWLAMAGLIILLKLVAS